MQALEIVLEPAQNDPVSLRLEYHFEATSTGGTPEPVVTAVWRDGSPVCFWCNLNPPLIPFAKPHQP
jgi:hypothetical protein